MSRRMLALVSTLAVVVGGLTLSAAPAAAAGVITPWQSTVAVGASFSASANGCPQVEEETDTTYTSQHAELRVVTGTGADARFVTFGQPWSGVRHRFLLPGWVDPNQPAFIVGSCARTTYDFQTDEQTTEVVFTYAPAPIDIVAGTPAVTGPLATFSRTTAGGGQAIAVTVTGCQGYNYASASVLTGTDLTLAGDFDFLTGNSGGVEADGNAELILVLNTYGFDDEPGGPLAAGDYTVIVSCSSWDDETEVEQALYAAPVLVTVTSGGLGGTLAAEVSDDESEVLISGTGCTGGRTVTVTWARPEIESSPAENAQRRQFGRAVATRNLARAAHLAGGDGSTDAAIATDVTVVPEADGTWSTTVNLTGDEYYLVVEASCGDPLADGFAYPRTYVSLQPDFIDLYIDRVSPTSSPTGEPVTAQIVGTCDGEVTVAFLADEGGSVLSESGPITVNENLPSPATVPAPPSPGTYELVPLCDGEGADFSSGSYEVFTPASVAKGAGSEEPLDGWPSTGARETYDGKLGPITLPAAEALSGKALGPSELFASVPRPEGDFAITEITFDLVYADGTPVDPSKGQIGYFVIMDQSKTNPACPDGTFGLNGRLVAAAGTEKTVLKSPGPYGLVVHEDDAWTGTYRLASLADTDQQVFISYQFKIRRDLENVRPITTYFGSTTGCDWFNYTIGGTGGTDTQSHYLTVANDGRLIGSGGSLGNGGIATEYVNDRGSVLCQAKVSYGDEPVIISPDDVGYEPPRLYPDDTVITGVSSCPLGELLTKGERLRIDTTYDNSRPRSGVTGVFVAYVWEGGGPASANAGGATPIPGNPNFTG